MTTKTRMGRNPFEKSAPTQRAAAAPSPSRERDVRTWIREAIEEARRAEAAAKARVVRKEEYSTLQKIAGWLAIDFVAQGYVFGFRAILFAKRAFR